MKKQLATLVLGLVCSGAFSQTNTFPASGNAGIGTSTPSQQLTVAGSMNIQDPTAGKYLGFGIPGNNEYNTIGSLYSSAAFMISHGLKPHSSLAKLVYSFPTMSRSAIMVGGFSENGIKFYARESSTETVGDAFNDAPRMIIRNDGNVGIGTTSPSSKLTVAGNIDLSATSGGTGLIYMGDFGKRTGLAFTPEYPDYGIFYKEETNDFVAISPNGGGETNPVAYFSGTGNVGIGTTTPNEKLAVNGKIRAKEIKVENTNWPDYVFLPSYKVPSLQETEKHIKEKGHLPGIPSAGEVKANGVDLGDMNAKLLQKIEELTLHLIEQNKAMEIQNNKLSNVQELFEKQQQEIKELKAKIK